MVIEKVLYTPDGYVIGTHTMQTCNRVPQKAQ